jgi:hypothetical protein
MPYKKRQMHLAAFFHRGALAALLRPKFHATSRAPVECQVLGLVESRLAHPALRTCVPRSTGTRGLRAPPTTTSSLVEH